MSNRPQTRCQHKPGALQGAVKVLELLLVCKTNISENILILSFEMWSYGESERHTFVL